VGEHTCADRCPNKDDKRLWVCGMPQVTAGCSLDAVEIQLTVARVLAIPGAVTGTIIGIGAMIVAIPVLLNGILGLINNETGARISGGFAIGCSVVGCCKGTSCLIAMVVFASFAKQIKGATDVLKDLAKTQEPCTDACYNSLHAQAETVSHIANYYLAMAILCGIILALQVLNLIMASVSCCLWKKKA